MTTVREATRGDAEDVMAAHVAAVEAFGPDAYGGEQVAAWAEQPDGAEPYRESVEAADRTLVVAERDGAVAGFGELRFPGEDEDSDRGEVVAVYVHPAHVREGVGSALLGHLEALARDAGLRALDLTASMNAVEFYERRGYERVREDVHETTGGVELGVVVMRKDLGEG